MFIEINPAYLIALMLFTAGVGHVFMAYITAIDDMSVKTKRSYYTTTVVLTSYSIFYAIMTVTENELLRYITWAVGFGSGFLFFPLWTSFLLKMVPPKNKIILHLNKLSILLVLIVVLICVFSNDVVLSMERLGNQFSYQGSVVFAVGLVLAALLSLPLIFLQFKWWNDSELVRYRRQAKIFIFTAIISTSIGFYTDFIVPIFTSNTITPLGPVTILMASLTTYILMFLNKRQSITMRNVSGFTFSSIMMPILVIDRKNNVGLENKAAVEFFGKSIMEQNLALHISSDGEKPKQSFFNESFFNEIITVETPSGTRTCDMILTVERDQLGDTSFKVAVIRDKTEGNYKDSLLETVNQVSGILLEPDIGNFEVNLYMAMGMIAKAVAVDRVYVWENRIVDDVLRCSMIYEWSEGATPQYGGELTKDVAYGDAAQGLEDFLANGYCINRIVSTMTPEHQKRFKEQEVQSVLIAPVFIQEVFWGFVGFDDCHKERIFTENEEMILRSASRLIVNAMIRNDMTHRLDTALTDELTGARNRRYFTEAAEVELSQCVAGNLQYSVILIDVDFFKKVNDTYGHPVGDEVLKILVSRIRNDLKVDTLFARYGGEEFIASLPDLSNEDVIATAERIRANIEDDTFKIDDLEINVTISLGVAKKTAYATTLSDIIVNADKALYKAKQTGRNKVVYYE